MSYRDSDAAALLTAAVLARHDVPLTAEGAESVAIFHKHIVFFLDLHLAADKPDQREAASAKEPSQ